MRLIGYPGINSLEYTLDVVNKMSIQLLSRMKNFHYLVKSFRGETSPGTYSSIFILFILDLPTIWLHTRLIGNSNEPGDFIGKDGSITAFKDLVMSGGAIVKLDGFHLVQEVVTSRERFRTRN